MKLFHSGISTEQFLAEYWQRKPLLLRQAFPGIEPPLSADELAGLACETGSNARLVLEQCGDRQWCVQYGPFDEQRFADLPDSGWSLLVSDVERVVPAAQAIQQQFRFLPDWRHDDVMISYAPAGASVGAHIDAYDVFLLQLEGTRRWYIAEQFAHEFLPHSELEILSRFEAERDWLLEPGDMLYLPPGVAHHGIAESACMTCSIGFRAPSTHDMAHPLLDTLLAYHRERRYGDAGLQQQAHPAEITAQSLAQVRDMMQKLLQFDDALLTDWFGRYLSDARSRFDCGATLFDSSTSLNRLLVQHRHAMLRHHPDCRFFFSRADGQAKLFVNGEALAVSTELATALCADTCQRFDAVAAQCCTPQDESVLLHAIRHQWLLIE